MKILSSSSRSALLATAVLAFIAHPVSAQEDSGSVSKRTIIETRSQAPSNDSGVMVEQRGVVGIKESNEFAPKYKEKLHNYVGQIQMGLDKGWLTKAQADVFSSRLDHLKRLDAKVASHNYAEPGLDNLEKQVTQFNIDLSSASSTTAKPPAASPKANLTAPATATQKTKSQAAPAKSATPPQ